MAAMTSPDLDATVRVAAFARLELLSLQYGSLIPYSALLQGFQFQGERIPLISPRGIYITAFHRRAGLPEIPLSFNTAPPKKGRARKYDDEWGPDGLLRYAYFEDNPDHRDNAGLRMAMTLRTPLIYLEGHEGGGYRADFPVFIVGEDRLALRFLVSTETDRTIAATGTLYDPTQQLSREYKERLIYQRNHQRTFRRRVLLAYGKSCCVCRLRHDVLLDAAHILPDSDPRGEPWVSNGLSMCKIHHAAYDARIIGVRPDDLIVEVRQDILDEVDGPMLTYGLQSLHQKVSVVVPIEDHLRPNRKFLEEVYENFKSRSA
jgi:putative restriction endonuclease